MKPWIALAAAIMLAGPAAAQTMNADAFYKRAIALQKKGPMAIFSRGEIKLLMAEGKASGERARANRLAAIKAGEKPRYCPPEGRTRMNSNEFMKALGAIPASERSRIDMTEATTRIMARKFPC